MFLQIITIYTQSKENRSKRTNVFKVSGPNFEQIKNCVARILEKILFDRLKKLSFCIVGENAHPLIDPNPMLIFSKNRHLLLRNYSDVRIVHDYHLIRYITVLVLHVILEQCL